VGPELEVEAFFLGQGPIYLQGFFDEFLGGFV